ncbi:HTH-type transcriptional activator Btr [Streptococcus canis]|uniref:HTH-type transcriptional activator Btr n=1 Tax=Streptococcus canis TaxID=1329 RepID=A0A3P5Y3Z1_STRCB|nr:YSIRK-targeted surface antigen transcriptional regulator [Streptococcus canis]MDV5972367.1 YSIRK-targeted surface antigen transcriptional regulator [Streptococcus canis]QKG76819.1 YSIRK-targeted surface antigen transcriptional regulator [Streptococcus canis]VDC41558.1 HTH-type transcriptional activator Btr [Streptococcus canis]
MATFDFKYVQTLHNLSQLPISVMSLDKELIQVYGNEDYLLPYHQILKRLVIPHDAEDISFYEGLFEESFLIFPIRQQIVVIGPFYPYSLDKAYHEKLADQFLELFSEHTKEELITYMGLVPCFPIANMRSLLITIDAFFNTHFEITCQQVINQLSEHSKQIVADPKLIHQLKHENKPTFQLPTMLEHLNNIISLVRLGNPQLLKQEINRIPLSTVTSSSIPALRAEKNLSVIYFTRLLELSFEENTDVAKNYTLVKHYMALNEEARDLIDVLRIRCAAIISFSESIVNKSISDKRQMYNSVLHYVDSHLYSKLKVSDIASHLYVSESHLRSVFKKYSDISLQSHILKTKIQEAQLLLQRGMPVGEVAKVLHFYDTTHFLKTFKKYTGMSSNEYLAKYRDTAPK